MKKASLFGILLSFATNKMRWVVEVFFLTTYSHTWCLTSLKCSDHRCEINLFIWLETVWTLWLLPTVGLGGLTQVGIISADDHDAWRIHKLLFELRIISLLRLSTSSLTNFFLSRMPYHQKQTHSMESNTPIEQSTLTRKQIIHQWPRTQWNEPDHRSCTKRNQKIIFGK